MDKFDEWFNEPQGFSLRSERLYELAPDQHTFERIKVWLRAAFESGMHTGFESSLEFLEQYRTNKASLNASPQELNTIDNCSTLIKVNGTRILYNSLD